MESALSFPPVLGEPCPQWLSCSSPCVACSVSLCVHIPYMACVGLGACWLVERGLLCLSVSSHSEFPFQSPPCCISPSPSPSLPPSWPTPYSDRLHRPLLYPKQTAHQGSAPFIQLDRFSSLSSEFFSKACFFLVCIDDENRVLFRAGLCLPRKSRIKRASGWTFQTHWMWKGYNWSHDPTWGRGWTYCGHYFCGGNKSCLIAIEVLEV